MRQRRLAAVPLAAATLCAAVCGGCSSSTKSASPAGSPSPATRSATASASASPAPPPAPAEGERRGGVRRQVRRRPGRLPGQDPLPLREGHPSTSTCYDACATAWPPALTTGAPKAVDGADQAKLSTTTRTDGKTQIVYNGHPLYSFEGDRAKGTPTARSPAPSAPSGTWSTRPATRSRAADPHDGRRTPGARRGAARAGGTGRALGASAGRGGGRRVLVRTRARRPTPPASSAPASATPSG
ncbi:hypothetical protein O1L60_37245 [Streptomyces diastatochromogenes]|nr:hypothetical protein [Streptomyces diastatochromogenes]